MSPHAPATRSGLTKCTFQSLPFKESPELLAHSHTINMAIFRLKNQLHLDFRDPSLLVEMQPEELPLLDEECNSFFLMLRGMTTAAWPKIEAVCC